VELLCNCATYRSINATRNERPKAGENLRAKVSSAKKVSIEERRVRLSRKIRKQKRLYGLMKEQLNASQDPTLSFRIMDQEGGLELRMLDNISSHIERKSRDSRRTGQEKLKKVRKVREGGKWGLL